MNKKFTLSLLVLLICIIGLPTLFAQTPSVATYGQGTITVLQGTNTPPASTNTNLWRSLRTYIRTTETLQSATSAGEFGLDSTRYTGTVVGRGRQIGSGAFNITSNAQLANAGFLRFEDNMNDTSVGAFKFHKGDTIFVTLQSRNSTTYGTTDPPAPRFRFARAANATSDMIGYNIQGQGVSTMSFSLLNTSPDAPTAPFVAAGPTTTNTGTLAANNIHPDTLAILIDSTHTNAAGHFVYGNYAQLSLHNVRLTAAGRWLQGQTEVADTLLVSYGRNGMWNLGALNPAFNIDGGDYEPSTPKVLSNLIHGDDFTTANTESGLTGFGYSSVTEITGTTFPAVIATNALWENGDVPNTRLNGIAYDFAGAIDDSTYLLGWVANVSLGSNYTPTATDTIWVHDGTIIAGGLALMSDYAYLMAGQYEDGVNPAEAGKYILINLEDNNSYGAYATSTSGEDFGDEGGVVAPFTRDSSYYLGFNTWADFWTNGGVPDFTTATFPTVVGGGAGAGSGLTLPVSIPNIANGQSAAGVYFIFTDSTLINLSGMSPNRAPVTVRRGNSYWTYNPGWSAAFDSKTDGAADERVGGAPVLMLTLLPGDAKFVRWNVGFGGDGSKSTTPGVANADYDPMIRLGTSPGEIGKLVPTPRRIHARGKTLDVGFGGTPSTPANQIFPTPGVVAPLYADWQDWTYAGGGDYYAAANLTPYTVEDTTTRMYENDLFTALYSIPDTLFLFDQDSNLVNDRITAPVLVGADSTGWSSNTYGSSIVTNGRSNCDNLFSVIKYDTIYEAGRRIFNWGFDRSNNNAADRIRKIRLIAYLPKTKDSLGCSDTLNSAFQEIQGPDGPYFATKFAASNHSTILIAPGPVDYMTVLYQRPGGIVWESFVDGRGISITSSEAEMRGHRLRATLRDRCDNMVDEALVSMNAYGASTYLDTLALDAAANTGAGLRVWGYSLNEPPDPALGDDPSHPRLTPTQDTLFLFARANAGSDDGAQVTAQFNTSCQNDVIYFAFNAFLDSNALPTSTPPGGAVTGDGNPRLLTLGGMNDNTYKITIDGSGGTPQRIFLTSSANGFVRNSAYPAPDTAFTASRSACADDASEFIEFMVRANDACNRPVPFTDPNQVTFGGPVYIKGGWGTIRSWNRTIPGGAGAYARTGNNYWGDPFDEANGIGTDSLGYWCDANGNRVSSAASAAYLGTDGNVYVRYMPPDMSRDTIRISAALLGAISRVDTNIIATISNPPQKFRMYMRPKSTGDTTMIASRGALVDKIHTTYAYGVLRDCNEEVVSEQYDRHTNILWRLEGTSRWSAFLFDPTLVYGEQIGPDPNYRLITDNTIDNNILNAYDLTEFRGVRQLRTGLNSDQGRSYIGINTDTVGAPYSRSGRHVFANERGVVFPTETFSGYDSLHSTYAWNGNDPLWNRALKINADGTVGNDADIPSTPITRSAHFIGHATTANLAAAAGDSITYTNMLRGFNLLKATAFYTDTVNNKVVPLEVSYNNTTGTLGYNGTSVEGPSTNVARYIVKASDPNQIAWVDGTGDYFDKAIYSTDNQLPGLNFLNLYGRQAGRIFRQANTPTIITTREIIAEDNKGDADVEENKVTDNSWSGGRNYAGRINPLYVRVYDMFGNPADYQALYSQIRITKGTTLNPNSNEFTTISGTTPALVNRFARSADTMVSVFTTVGPKGAPPLFTNLGSAATPNYVYYNQYFIGGTNDAPTNRGGYGARAAVTSNVRDGKLRGAVKVQYQTLSHTGQNGVIANAAGSDSAIRIPQPNLRDAQQIAAEIVISGSTLADTAIIRSKPTEKLADFEEWNNPNASTGRVGVGNVVDWLARDNSDEYPAKAQLVWYDYRVRTTRTVVATNKVTNAPMYDLYGSNIVAVPNSTEFNGYAKITNYGGNSETDFGTHNPAVLFTNNNLDSEGQPIDTTFGPSVVGKTFTAKQFGRWLGADSGTNSRVRGFAGGAGRVLYSSLKSDTGFAYGIINPDVTTSHLDYAIGTTVKFNVLPGYIHWVAMANPDAVDMSKEATYPYPVRRDFDGLVQFQAVYQTTPTLMDNPWNQDFRQEYITDQQGTYTRDLNPRSYSAPVDTIFTGQLYNIELRNYDRYGNRNTIDSIYISVERPGDFGFWDFGGSYASGGGEVLLVQDTTKKELKDVYDVLQAIPQDRVENYNRHTQLRLHYSNYNYNRGVSNKPDIINAIPPGVINPTGSNPTPDRDDVIVGYRDIFIKKLEKPGKPGLTGASIFRVDDGDFDVAWTPAASTNLYDDAITYTMTLMDGNTVLKVIPVSGSTNLTIPTQEIIDVLELGPDKGYNRTINWFVEAKNKWGLTEVSNTISTIFELNSKLEDFGNFKGVAGAEGGIVINSTDKITFVVRDVPLLIEWDTPADKNSLTNKVVSSTVMSHGRSYTGLDTVFYKVVLTKKDEYPVPVDSSTVPPVSEYEVALGSSQPFELPDLAILLGDADEVTYDVTVLAKDRGYKAWDDANYVTAGKPFTLVLTKIGQFAYILVDKANQESQPAHEMKVTETHTFELTAYDDNDNVIRGFNSYGIDLKLLAEGASTDRKPNQIMNLAVGSTTLAGSIADGFTLPSALFVNGVVKITYANTKCETVKIAVPSDDPTFKMTGSEVISKLLITGAKTREFVTIPGDPERLHVEVKPRATDDNGNVLVFVQRAMEVVVTPTDLYGNEVLEMKGDGILISLTARYPDEFVDWYHGQRAIKGKVNYTLTPVRIRDDQWIQAFIGSDLSTIGQSNSFRIVGHAPSAFTLIRPNDNSQVILNNHDQKEIFAWNKSVDPNDKPLITTVPLSENKVIPDTVPDNDIVKYIVKIEENPSITIPHVHDTAEELETTGTVLYNMALAVGGNQPDKEVVVNWFVIATDGLFETKSNSHKLTIKPQDIISVDGPDFIPETFALGQNYPNPFNPTTNIQYDIASASDVKIVIYNILGQPVRTLVNERKEAARYNVVWDGKNDHGVPVATGVYIYQIKTDGFSATKKMNLLK